MRKKSRKNLTVKIVGAGSGKSNVLLRGFARLGDFTGEISVRTIDGLIRENDAEALAQDWSNVGAYLTDAMSRFEREQDGQRKAS